MDAQTIKRWMDGVAFERGRTAVPAGFPSLPDIPGGRYWEPEFFTLESEALFKRGWVYVGHTDQLPEPGSFNRLAPDWHSYPGTPRHRRPDSDLL